MLEQTKEPAATPNEFEERYVVNADGERIEVILSISAFEQLLAELHELREKKDFRAEIDAWDRASDEALVDLERTLS